ncbi:MAG: ABC transporter substrate-binding protein [Burkholderiales bacterium]|nr:ABC transporter substrate-binding protein [Burkholderiales bacterium]
MKARVLVLALGLLLAAVARAGTPSLRLVDDAGHEVALSHPAQRIIALAPHLTELVYAAGAGRQLVAVGKYSDFPPDALTKPVISDAFAVNYEALAGLKPDLVLVWGSGTPERIKSKLRTLGVQVYEIEIRSVAGLADTLRGIGRLAGTEGVAQARAQAIAADWAALKATYGGRRPVRVFFQLWDAPLMTLNGQHLVSSAIAACGGINVFAELPTLTATVSWEVAVQRDPELVLTAGAPGETGKPGRWSEFKRVSAVAHAQFGHVEGDLLDRSGPRFVDGARELCEAVEHARQGLPQPVFGTPRAAGAASATP